MNKNLENAIRKVSEKFQYKSDRLKIFDSWRIMPEKNGKLSGDCDDFTITCLWEYSDRNIVKFLWNTLVTHNYQIHRAKTVDGEYHIVGCIDKLWFDNWSLGAMTKTEFFKTTRHYYVSRYYFPIIALYLFIGLFKK